MAEKSTPVGVRKSTPATAGHPLSSLRERWDTLFDDFFAEFPPDADAGKARASFSKGVLSISVPKSAEAHGKVKKIDVTAS